MREQGERIICHSVGEVFGFGGGIVDASQYLNINIQATKSGQTKDAVKFKNQKVHVSISRLGSKFLRNLYDCAPLCDTLQWLLS